jgi:hypothetical protein
LTHIFQDAELFALRDAVTQLGRAIAVSDLAAVEASTAQIQSLIEGQGDRMIERSQAPLLEEVNASTQELADLLASRLRAYDMAIAAWREPAPGR